MPDSASGEGIVVGRAGREGVGWGVGIGFFVVGVLLLIAVFYFAYQEMVAVAGFLRDNSARLADIGLIAALKGLFLLVMGFAASAIANKGIMLYQASHRGEK